MNLQNANLRNSNWQHANFTSANLQDTFLALCVNLDKANLTNAIYNSHTSWPSEFSYQTSCAVGPKANLKGRDLSKLNLTDIDLMGAICDKTTIWPPGFNYRGAGALDPFDLLFSHVNNGLNNGVAYPIMILLFILIVMRAFGII